MFSHSTETNNLVTLLRNQCGLTIGGISHLLSPLGDPLFGVTVFVSILNIIYGDAVFGIGIGRQPSMVGHVLDTDDIIGSSGCDCDFRCFPHGVSSQPIHHAVEQDDQGDNSRGFNDLPFTPREGAEMHDIEFERISQELAESYLQPVIRQRGQPMSEMSQNRPWRSIDGSLSPHGCGPERMPVTAALGPVSRASSVHTAVRNYTGDEGRSFEFDNQVLIP